jgi:hypothetical protein
MKTYLKNFAVSLIALGIMASGTAVAQNEDGGRDWRQGPPSVEDVLARMSEALDLSDQQSVDLLVVLQGHAAERADLHEQSMALIGPEICAQKASAEEDILAILTPDQVEQFLALKELRKAKATGRKRGKGPRGPDCSQYETDS